MLTLIRTSSVNMNIKQYRYLTAAALLVWMILIFMFSAQSGELSSSVSEGFAAKLFWVLYPKFRDMSLLEKTSFLETVMLPIRKLAHFTLYFVLGLFSSLFFVTLKKYTIYIKSSISFLFCVLYAASDEIHQYFVPNRACSFRDILIDSAGALLSVALFTVVVCSKSKFKRFKKII